MVGHGPPTNIINHLTKTTMTNFNLIQDAIKLISNDDNNAMAVDLLKQFVRANTPTTKNGKLNLWNWVSRDKICRPMLLGVFHDTEQQTAVATDTHVLIASKDDYKEPDSDTQMEDSGKGYIITKKGEYITGYRFPDWRRVIPTEGLTPICVNRERIREFVHEDDAAKKAGTARTLAIRISSEKSPAFVSPQYCKLLLTLPEGNFWMNKSKCMTKFVSTDGKVTALFMHIVNCNDERMMQDVIKSEE
jgi:hypothetical protein